MMVVTTGTVKKLITKSLHELLPTVKIYKTTVEQGFSKPCFFVRQLSAEQEKKGPLYERYYQFVIRYHPKKDDGSEVQKVQDILCEALPLLRYDDLILRCNPQCKITDGVLQVIVNYTLRLKKTEKKNPMQSIEEIKGGIS